MKEIPNHDNVLAGADGKIYSPSGTILKEYTNGDGYKTVLVSSNGKFSTKGVHRLIAMAYHETDEDVSTLLVNHLDLDKTNNVPSNVVWATPLENNVHAALMGRNSKGYRIVASNGNEDMLFRDCYELAEYLDVEVETAYNLVISDTEENGWTYKHRPFDGKIPKSLHRPNIIERNELGQAIRRPVSIINIYTKAVIEFDSIASAAKYFEVPTHFISQRISKDAFRLYNLCWMIFYGTKNDVPEITEDILSSVLKGKKRPLVCRHPDDTVKLYMSAKAFYTERGLSKKAVTSRLSKNGTAAYKDYVFGYVGTPLAIELLGSGTVTEVRT